MSTILEDSKGNAHFGTRGTVGNARITVDFDAGDTEGIGLDVAACPTGSSERAAIKLGDFTFGQDVAKDGTKNLAVLNASGVKVAEISSSSQGAKPEFYSTIPLIVAPTGSMGNNGALTSGTANPLIYLKTYTWFPTGALYTASVAGWYYTVWTTTTAATVYADTWNGTSIPAVPASPTALVSTGPGAFTGPTTEAAYITISVPISGVNSVLELNIRTHQTNNANVKTLRTRMNTLAGTVLSTLTVTSFLYALGRTLIKHNGVADKQEVFHQRFTAAATALDAPALQAETMSTASALCITVAKATATDVLVIESIELAQTR